MALQYHVCSFYFHKIQCDIKIVDTLSALTYFINLRANKKQSRTSRLFTSQFVANMNGTITNKLIHEELQIKENLFPIAMRKPLSTGNGAGNHITTERIEIMWPETEWTNFDFQVLMMSITEALRFTADHTVKHKIIRTKTK